MSSHLSESEVETLRKELLDKKQQLENTYHDGEYTDELEVRLLQQTLEALDRLQSREFGICQECEEPVPFQRLMAVPETKYCVECESALEEERALEIHRSKSVFAS